MRDGMSISTLLRSLTLLLFMSVCLSACSGRTGMPSKLASADSDVPQLSEAFVVTSSGNVSSIGFKLTNSTDHLVTITFPTSPVSFYYEISTSTGNVVATYTHGVLQSMETYALLPQESIETHSFSYTKSDVTAEYHISNTVRYYLDGVLHTDVVRSVL